MKKFPIYLQDGIKDCALACVMMILRFYKGNINPIKLSEMLKTTKNGTSAYNIIETLKYLGFKSEGIKTTFVHIPYTPCIAHVVIDKSYKHFVVIYKIDYKNKIVTIGDPAVGLKYLSIDEFLKIWTGIIITMYPVKKITNEKNINIYKFILSFLKPFTKKIILIGFLSLIITILSIVNSFFFQIIIENKNIVFLCSLFILLSLFKIIFDYLRNNLLLKLKTEIDHNLTSSSFSKIVHLPYSYYHGRTSGEIVNRINDLKNVKDLITNLIIIIFTDIPLMFLSALCLFYLSHTLFVISLFSLLLIMLVSLKYHKKLKKYIDLNKNYNTDNMSFMVESIEGFETIKGTKAENVILKNFELKYSALKKAILKLGNVYNKEFLIKELVSGLSMVLIIILGLYYVKNNIINLGTFITFMILLSYFLEPLTNITELDTMASDAVISLRRIIDITTYNEIPKLDIKENKNISLKNVNFSFNNKNILNNLNIDINPAEKIMIMGSSGSGKSTMLKLMMKYYDPVSGKVDTGDKQILYISNNEKLFSGTLKDNLMFYGDNDLTKITEICELKEILDNDLGLYQLIEENGFNYSGGQRQRIALARALMKKFNVLLIDEGLSQMDLSLERRILKNIFNEFSDKTIIVVSHRFDNADLFDRVIKLKKGTVIFDEKKNKGEDL